MKYRPDIDGLRALAVTSVVCFHAAIAPFSSGFVGVDIFFVISGYLIGGIIYRDLTAGHFSFAAFYARRARRILPALFAVTLTTCVTGWFLLDASELHNVGSTAATALLAMSNISFWHYQDYFASDSRLTPLLMTWTLGVEEQFYILFPLLLIGLVRWQKLRILPTLTIICGASFAFSLWGTWHSPSAAYYLLPSRAWELAVGALFACYEISRKDKPTFLLSQEMQELVACVGITLIAVAVFGFNEHACFPGFIVLLPVFGALALIMTPNSRINRQILSAQPVVFVGLISYSWYLWHWPLLSYLRLLFLNEPPQPVLTMAAIVSFGVAILSWKYIEQPFRKLSLAPRITLARYAMAMAFALILPLALKFSGGWPQRLNEATHQIENTVAAGRGNCLAMFDINHPDLSSTCIAPIADRPSIALIGDSHAAALGPALRDLAANNNMGISIYTKSSCAPLLGVTTASNIHPGLVNSCPEFMSEVFSRVVADPAITTVFLASFWSAKIGEDAPEYYAFSTPHTNNLLRSEILRTSLKETINYLIKAGKQVIVVEDVPQLTYNPVLISLNSSIPAREIFANIAWTAAGTKMPEQGDAGMIIPQNTISSNIVREAASETHATYLDLYNRFCTSGSCRFMDGADLLYIDNSHLSKAGSHYALENFTLNRP